MWYDRSITLSHSPRPYSGQKGKLRRLGMMGMTKFICFTIVFRPFSGVKKASKKHFFLTGRPNVRHYLIAQCVLMTYVVTPNLL